MGGGAAFGHADTGHVLRAQLQQVRGSQFMGDDNGACWQLEMPGLAQQCAQYSLLQIPQVVGALGKQGFAQAQQHCALGLDCIAPGMGGGAALFDGASGGVQ